MEPISATLAAIALVKAGLEHASDLKDIGSSIDNLLRPKRPEEARRNSATKSVEATDR